MQPCPLGACWHSGAMICSPDGLTLLPRFTLSEPSTPGYPLHGSCCVRLPKITVKLVLNDCAKVEDAKVTIVQDKTESDYSRRLMVNSLQALLKRIDTSTLKGIRDRALISVMGRYRA